MAENEEPQELQTIKDNTHIYYTKKGKHSGVTEDGLYITDDPNVGYGLEVNFQIYENRVTSYFIMANENKEPFNVSLDKVNSLKHKKGIEYIKVSFDVFQLYLKYLETNSKTLYSETCRRCI